MSNNSNNQGRAYEFICLLSLNEAIKEFRPSQIIQNSSYAAAENAWNTLDLGQQQLYALSAKSTIETIFAMEPNIVEGCDDILNLYIQNDHHGEDDIRFEEASHEVKPVFNKKCKNDSRHLILCFYSNFSLL